MPSTHFSEASQLLSFVYYSRNEFIFVAFCETMMESGKTRKVPNVRHLIVTEI